MNLIWSLHLTIPRHFAEKWVCRGLIIAWRRTYLERSNCKWFASRRSRRNRWFYRYIFRRPGNHLLSIRSNRCRRFTRYRTGRWFWSWNDNLSSRLCLSCCFFGARRICISWCWLHNCCGIHDWSITACWNGTVGNHCAIARLICFFSIRFCLSSACVISCCRSIRVNYSRLNGCYNVVVIYRRCRWGWRLWNYHDWISSVLVLIRINRRSWIWNHFFSWRRRVSSIVHLLSWVVLGRVLFIIWLVSCVRTWVNRLWWRDYLIWGTILVLRRNDRIRRWIRRVLISARIRTCWVCVIAVRRDSGRQRVYIYSVWIHDCWFDRFLCRVVIYDGWHNFRFRYWIGVVVDRRNFTRGTWIGLSSVVGTWVWIYNNRVDKGWIYSRRIHLGWRNNFWRSDNGWILSRRFNNRSDIRWDDYRRNHFRFDNDYWRSHGWWRYNWWCNNGWCNDYFRNENRWTNNRRNNHCRGYFRSKSRVLY